MKITTGPTRLVAALAVAGLVAAACGSDDDVDGAGDDTPAAAAPSAAEGSVAEPIDEEVLESGATVRRFEADSLTIHTFTNPISGFANTTTVFESDSALVLVDTHFSTELAADFRAYADALDKPIDRVLITPRAPRPRRRDPRGLRRRPHLLVERGDRCRGRRRDHHHRHPRAR